MKKTQYHQILQDMENRIHNGNWAKGEKIPTLPELSSEYQVSVSTIREVLKVLESRGYLTIQQGRGTFVASRLPEIEKGVPSSSVYEVLHLIKYRMMIEPTFAETAARLAYQDEVEAIRKIAHDMERLVQENSPTIDEDVKFHMLIACATHNDFAIESYLKIKPLIQKSIALSRQGTEYTRIQGMKERAVHYHNLIADAIYERDGEKARKYMYEHLEGSYELAIRVLTYQSPIIELK